MGLREVVSQFPLRGLVGITKNMSDFASKLYFPKRHPTVIDAQTFRSVYPAFALVRPTSYPSYILLCPRLTMPRGVFSQCIPVSRLVGIPNVEFKLVFSICCQISSYSVVVFKSLSCLRPTCVVLMCCPVLCNFGIVVRWAFRHRWSQCFLHASLETLTYQAKEMSSVGFLV